MRVFIAVLVLIFSFQSWTKAEDKIYRLFGVELNTDISLYANVEDGTISDGISSSEIIYTFQNKHLSKINRDPVFKNYLIRTDKNYKVKVLNAGKNFSFENKKFSDKDCNEEKNNFIKIYFYQVAD